MKKNLILLVVAVLFAVPAALAIDLRIGKSGTDVLTMQSLKRIVIGDNEAKLEGIQTLTVNPEEFDSFIFDPSDNTTFVDDIAGNRFSFNGELIQLASAGDIAVYNIAGAVCRKAHNVESLSVADLANGLYVVEVADVNGRASVKIFKK